MNQIIKPIGWCAALVATLAVSGANHATAQAAEVLQPTWTYASGTSGWIPDTVSIGDDGQRVFSAVGTFGASARLFSATATPIATDEHNEVSYRHRVDSSEADGRRVWLHYRSPSASSTAVPELRVYDSDNSTPAFTYSFPFQVSQPFGGVGMSQDGNRTTAWVYDAATLQTKVVSFQGSTSTPSAVANVATFLEPTDARLSADGTRLYLVTGTKTFVVDTTNGSTLQSNYNFHTVGTAHAINAQGDHYAQGTASNDLKVFREQSGSFTEWFTHSEPGAFVCSRVAFSQDGTTLAATFDGTQDQRIKLVVLDISGAQPVVLFEEDMVGSGALDLATSDLEINDSGSRVFVGTWGDGQGLVPEVAVYSQSGGTNYEQTHKVVLSGSVRDLDIDAAGDHLAVASKTVHATQLGGGGRYDSFELTSATGVRVVGRPTAGGSVEVRVACEPDSVGILLANDHLAANPTEFANVGRLYLSRSGLQFLARVSDNGTGELSFTLDLSQASAGDTIHLQGLTLGPRRLTPGALTVEVIQ